MQETEEITEMELQDDDYTSANQATQLVPVSNTPFNAAPPPKLGTQNSAEGQLKQLRYSM